MSGDADLDDLIDQMAIAEILPADDAAGGAVDGQFDSLRSIRSQRLNGPVCRTLFGRSDHHGIGQIQWPHSGDDAIDGRQVLGHC